MKNGGESFLESRNPEDELQEKFPVDSLGVNAEDLAALRNGSLKIPLMSWVSRLRQSDMRNGQAESWVGVHLVESALKAGKWVRVPEAEGIQTVYDAGYARPVVGNDGKKYAFPTEKLAEFVKSRFMSPQEKK